MIINQVVEHRDTNFTPIYVDGLMTCLMSKAWKWPKACHLFIDANANVDELHKFAARIGMKRAWFQSKPGKMPHYDLTEKRRAAAIKAGAICLDRASAVVVIRRWRATRACAIPPRELAHRRDPR